MANSTEGRRRGPARAPTSRREELARLHGRHLGVCAKCGRTVYFEQNFTRFEGRVVHVRCPIARD